MALFTTDLLTQLYLLTTVLFFYTAQLTFYGGYRGKWNQGKREQELAKIVVIHWILYQ